MSKQRNRIYSKKHYWGRRKYNDRTGLYKGEKRYSSDGSVTDWKGRTIVASFTVTKNPMG